MKSISEKKQKNKYQELPGGGNILAAGKNAAIWKFNTDDRAAIYFNHRIRFVLDMVGEQETDIDNAIYDMAV